MSASKVYLLYSVLSFCYFLGKEKGLKTLSMDFFQVQLVDNLQQALRLITCNKSAAIFSCVDIGGLEPWGWACRCSNNAQAAQVQQVALFAKPVVHYF